MSTRNIELSEEDLEIVLDALRKLRNHYKGNADRILKSGYGRDSTKEKSKEYLSKCEEIDRIETDIAYRFI